jgi:hypothetical protein
VRARFLGEDEGEEELEEVSLLLLRKLAGGNEKKAGEEEEIDVEETKFLTLVCQTMGDERLVRLFLSSGPLRSDASGTAPRVLPVWPFRLRAC